MECGLPRFDHRELKMLREGLLYLSQQSAIQQLVLRNGLARRIALRFVAGETLEQALEAVRRVNAHSMTASLNYLGENVTARREAERFAEIYVAILDAIAVAGVNANISIKLTSLGLDLSRELATVLARKVLDAAARHNNFVRIDMESSAYTQITIDIVRELFAEHKNVGTVIQAYLYRSEADIRLLNSEGIRVRLVKGAYLEPPTVAFLQKNDVDENYRRLADLLLREGTYPAFATHDERIIEWIKARAHKVSINATQFEFQMLYGVRRDLQARLRQQGYNMRVYIPYGQQWYPYLMRRLAERPANLLFVISSLMRETISR
jgi:proline dehydrogenase